MQILLTKQEKEALIFEVRGLLRQFPEKKIKLERVAMYEKFSNCWINLAGISLKKWIQQNSNDFVINENNEVSVLEVSLL